jgi:hypothetical protein
MNPIPPFIAFQDSVFGLFNIYQFNGKDWFLRPEDPNAGFELDTFQKYSHNFITGETQEEIASKVALAKHKLIWGNGKGTDIYCPCGFGYSLDPYTDEGLNENFSKKIPCICGRTLLAKVNVEVSFTAEIVPVPHK